jgi:hypothetical protein
MTDERKWQGQEISCLALAVVLAGIAILGLFFVPNFFEEGIGKNRQRVCEIYLKQIWALANTYRQEFGGPEKRFPAETGKAFWLKLTETAPPLVPGEELEVLMCPDSEESPRAGFTTYLGPSKDANTLGAEDVIGCCRQEHPDGFVFLLKNGKTVVLKGDKAKRLMTQVKD